MSVGGGGEPVWDRDGRSLYYRTGSGDFIVASVRAEPQFTVVERRSLFPGDAYYRHTNFAQYDISPSGDRFVMLKDATDADAAGRLILVQNFVEELKARVSN